ncbi:MAG: hypothetical protein SPK43_01280 [Candidatus Onthovivens sp.]|nr:hypothetical protein [Candidatus Onthovivens sp.]
MVSAICVSTASLLVVTVPDKVLILPSSSVFAALNASLAAVFAFFTSCNAASFPPAVLKLSETFSLCAVSS